MDCTTLRADTPPPPRATYTCTLSLLVFSSIVSTSFYSLVESRSIVPHRLIARGPTKTREGRAKRHLCMGPTRSSALPCLWVFRTAQTLVYVCLAQTDRDLLLAMTQFSHKLAGARWCSEGPNSDWTISRYRSHGLVIPPSYSI